MAQTSFPSSVKAAHMSMSQWGYPLKSRGCISFTSVSPSGPVPHTKSTGIQKCFFLLNSMRDESRVKWSPFINRRTQGVTRLVVILLDAYRVPGLTLGAEGTSVNKAEKNLTMKKQIIDHFFELLYLVRLTIDLKKTKYLCLSSPSDEKRQKSTYS